MIAFLLKKKNLSILLLGFIIRLDEKEHFGTDVSHSIASYLVAEVVGYSPE